MSFLNSIALWGLLAISIPIMIHFWNGKRGKTIAWAAMDFLTTTENRVSKGIQFENLLVLLLRILMFALLVLILAQLFLNRDELADEKKIAHVLHGERELWEEFRFEIQQALENGELVFVSGNPPKNIFTIETLFEKNDTFENNLQASFDHLDKELDSLIVYLPNSNLALDSDFYTVPISPAFKVSSQDPISNSTQIIQTKPGLFFQVNDSGILESKSQIGAEISNFDFSQQPIPYAIESSDEESQFIEAALGSISEVYGFSFQKTIDLDSATLIFANQFISKSDSKKLYFITNSIGYSTTTNQHFFPESWTFEDSEQIRNGQLPELILENYLGFVGLEKKESKLQKNLLPNRFLVKDRKSTSQKANLNEWLIMFLLVTLVLERILAFKQKI